MPISLTTALTTTELSWRGGGRRQIDTDADRDELHQLVTTYCRAVDRADYEALRSLYHPRRPTRTVRSRRAVSNSSSHSCGLRSPMCVSPNTTSSQRTS
ncbi:MAG TPA: nuclear transport factor 2 family protein [Mycobacterium sp.]|nr:nuclear transport factor 2 family protein [Mycobacterium sp.]HTX98148.1 nuclear transport factor 2 family protein [Mycobacterium sp.]